MNVLINSNYSLTDQYKEGRKCDSCISPLVTSNLNGKNIVLYKYNNHRKNTFWCIRCIPKQLKNFDLETHAKPFFEVEMKNCLV